MQLRHLWLDDFRSYAHLDLELGPGLTAIVGPNGEGKTNVLEAIAYLATQSSFRGAPTDAMVRRDAPSASVRAEVDREGRRLQVEASVAAAGRGRMQVNRQRVTRVRDLLDALRVSVFSPDDLTLVKEGPSERRRYLDDVMVGARPGLDALRVELDRVLRQRNALLRQAASQHKGRLTEDVELTLAVWDDKLVTVGEELATRRVELLVELTPALTSAYRRLAGGADEVVATYQSAWREQGLAAALAEVQRDELRRGVSLVGPHRDDVVLSIAGLPARTHASQGEQRSLALALRLAAHELISATIDTPPVLLLDDVLSELDPARAAALLDQVRDGQTLLTTAGPLPAAAHPEAVLAVRGGRIEPA